MSDTATKPRLETRVQTALRVVNRAFEDSTKGLGKNAPHLKDLQPDDTERHVTGFVDGFYAVLHSEFGLVMDNGVVTGEGSDSQHYKLGYVLGHRFAKDYGFGYWQEFMRARGYIR